MDVADSCEPELRQNWEEMPEEASGHPGLGYARELLTQRHMRNMRSALPVHMKSNVTELFVNGAAMAVDKKNPLVSYAEASNLDDDQKVALVLYGKLENLAEVRELYDLLPPGEDPLDFSATSESAELLMGAYLRGFVDAYGDCSAQPATYLDALQGDWSMVLYDASMEYLLVARDPGARAPLCWGTAAETGALLFASDIRLLQSECGPGAAAASEFPAGCFFESMETDEYGRVRSYVRRGKPMRAVGRVDSSGQLCGTMFRVASGDGLAGMSCNGSFGELAAQVAM
jgi:asparagine synthetase B (glutamine-hydrolysing)